MTAPETPDNGEILSEPATLQVVNLLARLNRALADDGPLFKRLDHADVTAHHILQRLEDHAGTLRTITEGNGQAVAALQRMIADVHGEVEKVTDVLAEYGPLLEQAKALANPGGIARAWVKGAHRAGKQPGKQ
jgi:hypothetical protein